MSVIGAARRSPIGPLLRLAVLLLASSQFEAAEAAEEDGFVKGAIHTIFSTDCKPYFSFQTMALVHSFARAGQPGKLTRIASCTREDIARMNPEDRNAVQTHFSESWDVHHFTRDEYPPYNRPTGVMDWLAKVNPREEWILMVDPDMLFRRPVTPGALGLTDGWSAGWYYNYLMGTENELAMTHVPDVAPRNDTYGGPVGRRADRTGHYFLLRNADLRRIAPFWLSFTEDVRFNKDAWRLTGDSYAKEGEKPWISEMYGYAFAAARSGVWHKLDTEVQAYPSYAVWDSVKLIHYGLDHAVPGYSFDKHNHLSFKAYKCPPWNMARGERDEADDAGLFPHPPHPSELTTANRPQEYYGALLVIEFVNSINGALCKRHKKMCPASAQLSAECAKVAQIQKELDAEYAVLDVPDGGVCVDQLEQDKCLEHKAKGNCEGEWLTMGSSCRKTCRRCFSDLLDSPQSQSEEAAVEKGAMGDAVTEGQEGKVAEVEVEETVVDPSAGARNQEEKKSEDEEGENMEESSPVPAGRKEMSDAERKRDRCQKMGIEKWLGDDDCRDLIAEGVLMNFTDVEAHSHDAMALLPPLGTGRADDVHSPSHSPSQITDKHPDGKVGRLVWTSQQGGQGSLGRYGIALWLFLVGLLAYGVWSSSKHGRVRRRVPKRRTPR
ncbi:unnamed protein product [Ostreobium quekettii]|uniref:Hydroxyproline O-arabinosyltransferase-like domain-containing protein n=1 Tax=Ostreobium quekettii TaxID=121088 RepID=A0A8S1IQV2_9CHLO|nr:unnamed protein product [Ostreobium quekettii]|eukprot:evm.model.scf_707.7 EVM.evm.TU.scf_707.7   scf_707:42262-45016(+)